MQVDDDASRTSNFNFFFFFSYFYFFSFSLGASEFDAAYLAPLYPQQVTAK